MDDALAKKPNALATVVENEHPRSPEAALPEADAESHSSDKDAASASTSSEELLFVDESVPPKPQTDGTAASPFGHSAKLPPRAPVCSGDPDVEGVLPSQPSIVRRMQDTNKHYVDPKDARALLPGVLFNSSSLELDEVLEGMEAQNANRANRVQEKRLQEEVLLGLLRQKELENLYLAQQQQQQRQQQELLLAASASGLDLELLRTALNEQCRVSPPGFPQQQFKQETPSNNMLFQQMLNKPRHGRSVSDPTFAFAGALNSMPPPFQVSAVDVAATTPVVDQSDALAFLNLPNFQQQPDWTAQDVQRSTLQPNLGGLFSMPNAMKPEVPKMDGTPQRRPKRGHSKSFDLQNKSKNGGYAIKDRSPPLAPASSGGKSTTRAEVKKMVQQQAALGRPTYAPWFRDRANRSNKEAEGLTEMPPSHHRTHSMPQVYTAPGSPEKKQETQHSSSKSGGRAGTGVFLPRMPVSN